MLRDFFWMFSILAVLQRHSKETYLQKQLSQVIVAEDKRNCIKRLLKIGVLSAFFPLLFPGSKVDKSIYVGLLSIWLLRFRGLDGF